jgi:crotonobetainyl-CoA hydratase
MNRPAPLAPVLVEHRGAITIITINRPACLNAIDRETGDLIAQAMSRADDDATTRVVILTGTGDRAFSAGADLRALARGEPVQTSSDAPDQFAGFVGYDGDLITIAAVNGLAYGGGMEIVLACDLALAAPHATFALPEVKVGMIAGGGGVFRLAERIPPLVAMEMLLTGEPIDAEQAANLHLVNRIVPPQALLSDAVELAERIIANAPLAVTAHKRILRDRLRAGPDDRSNWDRSTAELEQIMSSTDAQEGPRAFAEHRRPRWAGR